MKRDSKLSLALHILGHLGMAPDRFVQSQTLAGFHATHPVVVRRTLGLLRDAGIVISVKGHVGGWRLSRDPRTVTVADVYRALGEALDPAPGAGPDNPASCAIERALHSHWDAAVTLAETALLERLAKVSIADLSSNMANGLAEAHQRSSS